MTWDGRDVYRDEDGWKDNDDHDRIFYPQAYEPYDPRVNTHVEGAINPDQRKPCPRCWYTHVPEEGCECKRCNDGTRTDTSGYCDFCSAVRPIERRRAA